MLGPDPFLGLDPRIRAAGLVVTGVTPGGPAADAGFRPGDRILMLDGQPITDPDALSQAVEQAPVGREFRITLDRGGKRQELTVKSGPRPEPRAAPVPGDHSGPVPSRIPGPLRDPLAWWRPDNRCSPPG